MIQYKIGTVLKFSALKNAAQLINRYVQRNRVKVILVCFSILVTILGVASALIYKSMFMRSQIGVNVALAFCG